MPFTRSFFLIVLFVCTLIESRSQKITPIIEQSAGGLQLSIYLPPDFNDTVAYRVLYVNDGQTIFGAYGLNIDGSADRLILNKLIEPIIIVGIHSDKNRTSQYVPYNDPAVRMDFGEYEPYASFYSKKLLKNVIPFIEKKYRTKPGRGIAGYSFGGLHATWIALNYPEQFTFSAGLSPSYWVKDFKIFTEGEKARRSQTYYFDVGTGEWNYFVPWLLHSKLPILENIFYYEKAGATHSIQDWRGARINNILLLFAGKTDFAHYNWEIQPEVIKSAHDNRFYLRINPVIRYENGLICSISYAATYTLLNPSEDGNVNSDGSYRFAKTNNLEIKVTFRGEDRIITLNYDEIEKIKASLK